MVDRRAQHSRHHLLDELRALRLPVGDYVVFGSAPLLVRGWIDDVGDLDVLARGGAWDRAVELGTTRYLEEWDVTVADIGSNITVGTRWAIGNVDTDLLIETAEIIDGLPFASLEAVMTYKQTAQRPKDVVHLEIIERHTARDR